MLETIRDYALERLRATGEEQSVQRRHAAYYLRLAEAVEPELVGAQQVIWLKRLEQEHDNLGAALEWALEHGAVELAIRLGGALWRFWYMHGHLQVGRRWLRAVLAVGSAQPPPLRAKVLHGSGVLAWAQGNYPQARAFYEESLALYQELGDKRGIADVLSSLGCVTFDQGDYAAARTLHTESLMIEHELGDRWGIAEVLNNLGIAAREQGDYWAARALLGESLAIKRELGNKQGIARSLHNLGVVACEQGDYAAAHDLYMESLTIKQELGDTWGIAESLEGLAGLGSTQSDPARTVRLAAAAVALRESLGVRRPPAEEARLERWLEPGRRALSYEERAAAWAEGRAMSLEQAVAYALEGAS
jgi:non-specific serine/threonine protein kinase